LGRTNRLGHARRGSVGADGALAVTAV
jgi:hypothetical protein